MCRISCIFDKSEPVSKHLDAITLWSYSISMSVTLKRATVYFDPDLHRAVRLKAVNTNQSISDVVNDSLRAMLSEDEEDLAAFDETASDPLMTYEELLARLKADGKI